MVTRDRLSPIGARRTRKYTRYFSYKLYCNFPFRLSHYFVFLSLLLSLSPSFVLLRSPSFSFVRSFSHFTSVVYFFFFCSFFLSNDSLIATQRDTRKIDEDMKTIRRIAIVVVDNEIF